jgi:DNA-binding transcriptional MerR regulator
MGAMLIGELASRSGVSVRTLRFYADEGLLPERDRTDSGYRVFDTDAVARARLIRTLRDLGVGLDDIARVVTGDSSLVELAADHERALDAQIAVLRLQRSALRAFLRSPMTTELELMTELATLTADERRRIVDDYLDAVFGDDASAVADKMRMGVPELPDDPSADQVAAWVELAQLLRDPDFVESSRRMAERAKVEGPEPDVAQFEVGKAVGELAGAAMRAGVDPSTPAALEVVEAIEAVGPPSREPRAVAADRIEAFTDRRVARYWSLVGIVNGWPPSQTPDDLIDAWEWYARALRAHP